MKRNYTGAQFTPPPPHERFTGKNGFTLAEGGFFEIARRGFTLSEVLITLAIIGVVAALTIPSVIANTQQAEFKTGLKKAVSVLNQAITVNMALEGESPYENANLFGYLTRHMNVMRTFTRLPWRSQYVGARGTFASQNNAAFYTVDGMRFEFDDNRYTDDSSYTPVLYLHESDKKACFAVAGFTSTTSSNFGCGGCGSLGLGKNPRNTTKVPCAILVDVNGDRKPTPQRAATTVDECQKDPVCSKIQNYQVPDPNSKRFTDLFVILITEDKAIPYGVVAQRAMYSGTPNIKH